MYSRTSLAQDFMNVNREIDRQLYQTLVGTSHFFPTFKIICTRSSFTCGTVRIEPTYKGS